MEQKEKKAAMMSVPQFGGWDQKAPGATDYSMVFTQARANKKQQKTDLTEVKRNSLGNERDFMNANHADADADAHAHAHAHRHGHAHAHPHPHGQAHAHPRPRPHGHTHVHAHDDPSVMGKKKILTYINCCIRP